MVVFIAFCKCGSGPPGLLSAKAIYGSYPAYAYALLTTIIIDNVCIHKLAYMPEHKIKVKSNINADFFRVNFES